MVCMSTVREELHRLVDDLPEDQVGPALTLVRSRMPGLSRRDRALAALRRAQERMQGVTGVDEEIDRLRDNPRG